MGCPLVNPANDTHRTGSCGAQHPGSIFGHRPCKLDRGHSGIHCNRAGDTWTRGPEELCAPHIPGAGPRLQVCEHSRRPIRRSRSRTVSRPYRSGALLGNRAGRKDLLRNRSGDRPSPLWTVGQIRLPMYEARPGRRHQGGPPGSAVWRGSRTSRSFPTMESLPATCPWAAVPFRAGFYD